MKICNVCNVKKDLSMFYRNGKYHRPNCKECFTSIQMDLAKETRLYVESHKEKCYICGYDKFKRALEFHHINPSEKSFGIGTLISKRAWSIETKRMIDLEISKCVVLCANCHREVEYGFTELNLKEDIDKIKEL